MLYAQRINREKGWKGHLWHGVYFPSSLTGQLGITHGYMEGSSDGIACSAMRVKPSK
jgi:hypothetical protein